MSLMPHCQKRVKHVRTHRPWPGFLSVPSAPGLRVLRSCRAYPELRRVAKIVEPYTMDATLIRYGPISLEQWVIHNYTTVDYGAYLRMLGTRAACQGGVPDFEGWHNMPVDGHHSPRLPGLRLGNTNPVCLS